MNMPEEPLESDVGGAPHSASGADGERTFSPPGPTSSSFLTDLHRQLFRAMGSGVIIYRAIDDGADFEIVDVNPAVERIERLNRKDLIGGRLAQVFPAVGDLGLKALQRVWTSGRPERHPVALYSDDRITGWRENQLFRLASGEVVALYEDRTREVKTEQAEAQHELLAKELNHRLLNATHVVELIVRESLREEPARARIINQRIRAALAGLEIQGRAATEPINMRALLTAELAPFGRDRIRLHGPALPLLPARLRTVVTLASHELATNALKYGALSNADGRVTIKWRMDMDVVALNWSERGGPPVKPPGKTGYGSTMLRSLVEAAGGTLRTTFPVDGLKAEIILPRRTVAATTAIA
jgi:two-component sensor histidine kinase